MSICSFTFLQFLGFLIFGRFFGGGILGVSVEIWGILGVLVSYKIPRGIRMVVGRALKGFGEVWGDLGGSRGVRGGQGGSRVVKKGSA